jgi:hypothetical protein
LVSMLVPIRSVRNKSLDVKETISCLIALLNISTCLLFRLASCNDAEGSRQFSNSTQAIHSAQYRTCRRCLSAQSPFPSRNPRSSLHVRFITLCCHGAGYHQLPFETPPNFPPSRGLRPAGTFSIPACNRTRGQHPGLHAIALQPLSPQELAGEQSHVGPRITGSVT